MDVKGSTCPICFELLNEKAVGSPDICDHKFCLACLEKWTKHGNFCPVDRQKFKKIISGDEVIQIKYKRKKRSLDLYDISVHCEVCKDVKERNDTVLLCDSCDLAFHLDCLNPPLKSIPRGNWFCPDCQEVGKKLKSQKTKQSGKMLPHKASTNSKQSSSLFRHHLTSPTKQTGINKVSSSQNTNLKFAETKYNAVKESHLSKRDYYQKNLSCTATVNSPCTETPQGGFEDFLSFSDNDVILTKRKPLNTEEKSFNENIGKETSWLSRHVKNTTCSSFKTLQTERRTKRLAAAIARNKINQNLKTKDTGYSTDSTSSSSGQYSTAENDSQENASWSTVNHFADIKKSVLSRQSCTFSFDDKNAANYMEEFSLSEPKSMNEMDLEIIEVKTTRMENLNNSEASKCENLTTFTNVKLPDLVTEDLIGIDFLTSSEKTSCKVSPTSTKINNSEAEKLNNSQIHSMSESFSEHLTIFTNAKSSDSVTDLNRTDFLCASETAGCKASPTSTKINYSEAEKLNNTKIHTTSKSLSVSEEPDIILTNCKSLRIKEKSPSKRTWRESCRTISGVDSRVLRRNLRLHLTEMRTKRLAAANARKKLTENFKSSSDESSSDESSDSLDQHSVSKNDSLEKPPLNTSNHHLFVDIEKVLSRRNSPLLKNHVYTSSEVVISDSESPGGIKEKNTVIQHLNRNAASKSSSGYENPRTSSIPKVLHCATEDLNKIESLSVFEKPGCESSATSTKVKNSVAEELRNAASKSSSGCENPRTSSIPKVLHCVTEDLNKIESLSVFEKPGCESSTTSTKIKNSVAEELRNVQIHMASESFSVSEKPTIEEPPCLTLEPLNTPEKLGNEALPELLIEPLNVIRNHGNEMLPIIKEIKAEQAPSFVNELKSGSFSSAFSVFEKITDTSGSAKKQSRSTNGETHSHIENCQNENNLENDCLSQEKDNSSDMEVDGEENILDSFHIRQVHYAIKAKMNLPSELQEIEREKWLSHRSKSSRKYKYKPSCKKAEIRISSSSHHQIVSGNEQLYNFFQSTHLDCNKSTRSKKDLTECNKFNPFCESVSSTRPKKLFKVTEYKLQPSDKQVCFNNVPKNVLQNIVGPNGLKHLDIREDGSLFLNWAKSKSR